MLGSIQRAPHENHSSHEGDEHKCSGYLRLKWRLLGTGKNGFEEDLRKILEQFRNSYELIIGGDINTRVEKQSNSRVVGMHGEEVKNNNRERLISLCEQHKLKIMNGFFDHKEIHKYTWYYHSRGLKSIIDYVIVKQQTKLRVQNVKVRRGADCGSDHCMVCQNIYTIRRHKQR